MPSQARQLLLSCIVMSADSQQCFTVSPLEDKLRNPMLSRGTEYFSVEMSNRHSHLLMISEDVVILGFHC